MRRRAVSLSLAFVAGAPLVMLVGALGHAQSRSAQSPPNPQQAAPPRQNPSPSNTLRVISRMVQVRVIVRDKNGDPVTGLTKDDFVILDQGQRQKVATFSGQASRVTASASAPPNVFSNRAPQPALAVIVIDAYNARWWDETWCPPLPPRPMICAVAPIFAEVESFVRQMQAHDRVALYVLDGKGLFFVQDFTSDPATLERAVGRARDHVPGGIARAESDHMYVYTMEDMQPILDRLARVPGRKNLIWLGPGFPPAEFRFNTFDKIDETARRIGNSDVLLFPINKLSDGSGSRGSGGGGGGACVGCPVPTGVSRGPTSGVGIPTPALYDGNYGEAATNGRPPGYADFDNIMQLADLSGGHAADSIRGVIDESSTAYLLGYYPDHNKWNGAFREIKVKVNRPGVEIQARKGYYAVAAAAPAPIADNQEIAQAIRSPLESTDLNVDVQADAVSDSGGRQLKLTVSFDAAQLRFEKHGTRSTDDITEVWAQFDANGKQVSTHSQTLHLKPTPQEYNVLVQQGCNILETVPVADGAEELRLVFRDAGNGAIGSVTIPLTKLFPLNGAATPIKK